MASRNWKDWPKNAYSSLNQAGGFLGIAGIATGAVGLVVAAPVAVGIGAVTVGATCIYAAVAGFPKKKLNPNDHIGQRISLNDMQNLSETILKIGVFGASSSGKSTFLEHAITSNRQVAVTHDITATIVSLQTNPPKKVSLLDGDGKTLAQQFKIVKHADAVFIFLDHTASNIGDSLDNERLKKHEEYLNQLGAYLKDEQIHNLKQIHFVLNKKDLWNSSADKQTLTNWFDNIVNIWHGKNFSRKVTYSYHSNILASDITDLMNTVISIA